MNTRIVLACALACMVAAPARATFPIFIATGGGAATITISGGVALVGALGLTVAKAALLRELGVSRYIL